MARRLTVLISGAGIAGPALAFWLVRRGHRVVIVERTPRLRTGGHAVDIRGTALDVVERMGLDGAIRDARTQIATLSAVRSDGRRTYDVAIRPLQEMRGGREVEIMRDDSVRILFDAVRDDVEVVFGDSVSAITDPARGPLRVEFDRGAPREADLVVGADGHHSAMRGLVFGAEQQYLHRLGACLAIYTVDNPLGIRDRAVLYNEPGRAAAVFTARGNELVKVVVLFRGRARGVELGDPALQRQLLRERTHGMGWRTAQLLEAMSDAHDFYFDEMSQVRLPRWSTGRVVLLGDAAFGPSPMSGQGTSLALIGAHLLAHRISTDTDLDAALTRWENNFRGNVAQNQRLAADGLGTLVPASRPAILLRNQMLRAMPLLARMGRGFGGRVERASRAVHLPDG